MTESARLMRSPQTSEEAENLLRRAMAPRSSFRLKLDAVENLPVLVDEATGARLEGVTSIEVRAAAPGKTTVVDLSLVLFSPPASDAPRE